jgi:hypothetical protein
MRPSNQEQKEDCVAGKYKTHFDWNAAVYADRVYTAPDGTAYDLSHTATQTHTFKYKYRENGKRKSGDIEIDVRFDPHCFTREKVPGDTAPTLVIDQFNDGSTTERVFDAQRYEDSQYLAKIIPHLSNKDCQESRSGKVLYFKRKDGRGNDYGLYVILKLKREDNSVVMFVETAHTRHNAPYKMNVKPQKETFSIILGRMVSQRWADLL